MEGAGDAGWTMELISGIAAVVAPVFLISLAGFIWVKRGLPFDQGMVTQLAVQIATPCLAFSVLTKMNLPSADLGRMGAASLLCHLGFAALAMLTLKLMKLPARTYLPSMIFPNVGNLGLPLCLFAFGERGMALAMIFFAVSVVGQFTVGPAIAAGSVSVKKLLKLPFLHALIIAVLVSMSGIKVPGWVENTTQLAGSLLVPLMLMALGAALAQLSVSNFRRAFVISFIRVIPGGAIAWAVAAAMDLDPVYRGVLVIQSVMPAAVFNYLFARLYDTGPDEVASVILISTVLAYLALPAVVALVM